MKAVVGGVVGSVSAVLAAVLLGLLWRRHRRRRQGDMIRPGSRAELDVDDKESASSALPYVYLSEPSVEPERNVLASESPDRRRETRDSTLSDQAVLGESLGMSRSSTGRAHLPQSKTAMRQQEIARQVQEVQQTVAHSETVSDEPSSSDGGGDTALRQRIAALLAEADRLEQVRANDERLPEYHEEGVDLGEGDAR